MLAVFAFGWMTLRSDGSYEVTAVFDDVRGLIEGGEVKAGGLEVGKVEDITFTEQGMPQVRMADRLRLPARARARSRTSASPRTSARSTASSTSPRATARSSSDGATLGPGPPTSRSTSTSRSRRSTRGPASRSATLLAEFDAATRGRGPDLAETFRHSPEALGETANLLAPGDRRPSGAGAIS